MGCAYCLIPSLGRCCLRTDDLPGECRQPTTGCAVLLRAPVATVRAETRGRRLDECAAAPRGLWRCSNSGSGTCPMRINIAGSPVDTRQAKKAYKTGLS